MKILINGKSILIRKRGLNPSVFVTSYKYFNIFSLNLTIFEENKSLFPYFNMLKIINIAFQICSF